MKAILTLTFVFSFGAMALAQNIESHDKVQRIEMGVVLDSGTIGTATDEEVETVKEKSIARLCKFKNSRIKKALAFTTKRNWVKLV
ncbi:MAG: hypothetical protein QM485_05810 [Flavobacteriaceae bacterium]